MLNKILDKLVEAYSIIFRTRVQFPPSPFISFFCLSFKHNSYSQQALLSLENLLSLF
ncbi:conserved hypothetical protein [Borreliella burgdorferi JD1]|nr:conserved hypothetical protein [Borreliella burgdorferi N40]ADQ31161.1 conserved hypothetical protein [Borreliella burgdorferi JD1]